ncbi:hypothetical protein ACJRO7_004936 [Eucalyptus globulus]|uniref:Uncharacterized protein n=1 Tax=Eucalyptus globulus TaxID=34317 RepID=A0ABD3J442_EUCGL
MRKKLVAVTGQKRSSSLRAPTTLSVRKVLDPPVHFCALSKGQKAPRKFSNDSSRKLDLDPKSTKGVVSRKRTESRRLARVFVVVSTRRRRGSNNVPCQTFEVKVNKAMAPGRKREVCRGSLRGVGG